MLAFEYEFIYIWIHIILYDYVKIKRETYLWHIGRHRCISSIRGDGQFTSATSAADINEEECEQVGLSPTAGSVASVGGAFLDMMVMWILTRQWIQWRRQWSYGVWLNEAWSWTPPGGETADGQKYARSVLQHKIRSIRKLYGTYVGKSVRKKIHLSPQVHTTDIPRDLRTHMD
jgi:hypothetical protein